MIFKRKEAKAHGTGKLIEGIYKNGESCLVVDDVITSGVSIWETVQVCSITQFVFLIECALDRIRAFYLLAKHRT